MDASYPLTVQRYTIAGGAAGIMQTVRAMRALSEEGKRDPVVRQTALNIVYFLPQKDHRGEAQALFEFVRDQVRYVLDIQDIETLNTPQHTLRCGQGDCDDKATLLVSLLECIGLKGLYKLVAFAPGPFEHVYVVCVMPDGEQIPMDPTEPYDMGQEPPGIVRAMLVD